MEIEENHFGQMIVIELLVHNLRSTNLFYSMMNKFVKRLKSFAT